MGTNYYVVKSKPSVNPPIHIGKSSAGWMFLFHEQDDIWRDPPIVWHSFNDIKTWLEEYVVNKRSYVIMDEYDRTIDYREFIEKIETKQKQDKDNPDNFSFCKNVDGYRFDSSDFC